MDVRSKEAFAAAHIPGAINIPFGPTLPTWAGWVLPYDWPTLIVVDGPAQMPEVTKHLLRVGFDDIQGWLEGGMDAWQTSGYEMGTLTTLAVQTVPDRPGDVTILDVRTEKEWNAGHIDGAIHIHGGKLQENFKLVPRDQPVVVICGSGYRGSIAASFLKREGYDNVSNVLGGMSAWKASGLPFVTSEDRGNSSCRVSATSSA